MKKEITENQNKDFIYKMSEEEKAKEIAEAREDYLRDQRNAFRYYREKGIEKVISGARKAGVPENIIQEILDDLKNNDLL